MRTEVGKRLAGTGFASPLVALSVLGLASQAIYLVALTLPFSLAQHYRIPQLDLGKITQGDRAAEGRFVLAFAALFAAYVLAFGLATRDRQGRAMPIVLGFAALSAVWLFLMYPITSTDVFGYLVQGRVLSRHGANPLVVAPNAFPDDPFMPYTPWGRVRALYGPLWFALSAIPSLIAGDDLLGNVLIIKGLITAFHLANVVLIWRTLAIWRLPSATAGTLLYAWNPLVLFEGPGNGHNDIAMMTFVLLAVYLIVSGRRLWAIPALMLSALIKFVALGVVPVFLWYLVTDASLRTLRERFGFAAKTVALAGLLAAALFAPFWDGARTFEHFRDEEDFISSSPAALAVVLLEPTLAGRAGNPRKAAQSWVRLVSLALLAAVALWQTWRARRGLRAVVLASYVILFAFLLLFNFWFYPWYVPWVVALAPLADDLVVAAHSVVFSIAAMAGTIAFTWNVNWNVTNYLDIRVQWLAFLLFWAAPAVVFGYLLIAQLARGRHNHPGESTI